MSNWSNPTRPNGRSKFQVLLHDFPSLRQQCRETCTFYCALQDQKAIPEGRAAPITSMLQKQRHFVGEYLRRLAAFSYVSGKTSSSDNSCEPASSSCGAMVVTVIRDSHERRKIEGELEFCKSNFAKFSKKMKFFSRNFLRVVHCRARNG